MSRPVPAASGKKKAHKRKKQNYTRLYALLGAVGVLVIAALVWKLIPSGDSSQAEIPFPVVFNESPVNADTQDAYVQPSQTGGIAGAHNLASEPTPTATP